LVKNYREFIILVEELKGRNEITVGIKSIIYMLLTYLNWAHIVPGQKVPFGVGWFEPDSLRGYMGLSS